MVSASLGRRPFGRRFDFWIYPDDFDVWARSSPAEWTLRGLERDLLTESPRPCRHGHVNVGTPEADIYQALAYAKTLNQTASSTAIRLGLANGVATCSPGLPNTPRTDVACASLAILADVIAMPLQCPKRPL